MIQYDGVVARKDMYGFESLDASSRIWLEEGFNFVMSYLAYPRLLTAPTHTLLRGKIEKGYPERSASIQ